MDTTNQFVTTRCTYFALLNHQVYESKYKIEAIKEFRTITGIGLRDAKDFVEGNTAVYFNEQIAEKLRSSRFFRVEKMEAGICFVETVESSPSDIETIRKLKGIINCMFDLDSNPSNDSKQLQCLADTLYNACSAKCQTSIHPTKNWSF